MDTKHLLMLFLFALLTISNAIEADSVLFDQFSDVEVSANPLWVPARNINALGGKQKPRADGNIDIYFPDTDTHIHVGGRFSADQKNFEVQFVSFKINGVGPGNPDYAKTYPKGRNLDQRADGRYDTVKLPAMLAAQKNMLINAAVGY